MPDTRLTETVVTSRTLLFVPGDRPERFAKAAASGAGLVVLDLEDAVSPEHKEAARVHVRAWLAEGHRCAVRINATGTPWHDEDVEAVSGHGCALMVPMADSAEELRDLARRAGTELIALVETVRRWILSAPASPWTKVGPDTDSIVIVSAPLPARNVVVVTADVDSIVNVSPPLPRRMPSVSMPLLLRCHVGRHARLGPRH